MSEPKDPPKKTQRLWQTPAGVKLIELEQLERPSSRGFVLQIGESYFHGFVVWTDDAPKGFVDHCPHSGVPLSREVDGYLTEDASYVACNWHGALFRTDDGHCVGGPCTGQSLRNWPVEVVDGWLVTA